mmetsp:Transcript_2909/g.4797  ORF Transcript_2909/g.4797 Transcript_2909/m.4797 type:complete len:102 (+) Transcript_2909:950-1255(+)
MSCSTEREYGLPSSRLVSCSRTQATTRSAQDLLPDLTASFSSSRHSIRQKALFGALITTSRQAVLWFLQHKIVAGSSPSTMGLVVMLAPYLRATWAHLGLS